METLDFSIENLGEATITSPIHLEKGGRYISDDDQVLYKPYLTTYQTSMKENKIPLSFQLSGPREKIYFSPKRTKAAIVTCGGLCPGINAVVRALVMELWYRYGVQNIIGIPYGYQGLSANSAYDFIELTPEFVNDIHHQGGTVLGSSRGTPPSTEIVDNLEKYNINILFTIGGDGTHRGASAISQEVKNRNLKISVIGIPKTIDNDIPYVKQSFGFESAVEIACQAVAAAHEEARGAQRGIGLVKLMGRHSGYIATNTALASGDCNLCLIPEVPFALEGEGSLLEFLENRLETKDHAVIIVAEGAGQYLFDDNDLGVDASGNKALGNIGVLLKTRITEYFKNKEKPVNLKYIDPSYIIRSTPPNASDLLFCATLAQNATHAAMCGKTAMSIGYWHGTMTHIPFKALEGKRQTVDPHGVLWFNVIETTGQPSRFGKV